MSHFPKSSFDRLASLASTPVGGLAGLKPAMQQISDYLATLDRINRELVEREAAASPAPAASGVHDFASQPSVEKSLAALVADQQSRAAPAASKATHSGVSGNRDSAGKVCPACAADDAASKGAEAVAKITSQAYGDGNANGGQYYALESLTGDPLPIGAMVYLATPSEPEAQKAVAPDLAEQRAPLEIALEALEANHQWHKDYDDHDGYEDSEIEGITVGAITCIGMALRDLERGSSPAASMEVLARARAALNYVDECCSRTIPCAIELDRVNDVVAEIDALAAKNGWKLGEGQ